MDESAYLHFLWSFLLPGYLTSVAVETPVLLAGLSPRHSLARRLFSGWWLTACTYPVVVLVLNPLLLGRPVADPLRPDRWGWEGSEAVYLLVAETFAPVAECALFWAAFGTRKDWGTRSMARDFATITLANLASFGVGLVLDHYDVLRGFLPGNG